MPRKGMTPQQRAQRRRQMTEEFWKAKRAAARTPQARCQVAWDRIRAEMSNVPEHLRDQYWLQLAGHLERVPDQLPKR